MTDVINIGLLGLGTVGRGVWQLLSRENDALDKRLGLNIKIKKILVRDPAKERGVAVPTDIFTTDARDILDDDDIQIVVEVIGGTTIAKQLVDQALAAGKSVVTANKELMANYGRDVLDSADRLGVDVFFEASVGAGIPIIRPLKESLVANRIQRVMGIVNGTTNYILSKMESGQGYGESLAEAQALGYAERDPAADVEGKDAAAKLAILASIAFNSRVTASDVYTEGISAVTAQDIMYARELGYAVKLLAVAKPVGEYPGGSGTSSMRIDARVHPTMVPLDHPLAAVKDAYNAIFVEGDAVGELMFFGQGAGSLPTAGAVVGDIFLAADNIKRAARGRSGCTCFNAWPIEPIDQVESSFYLLIEATDKPGVLAEIAKHFGDHGVSLNNVIQKETTAGVAEVVFMTHKVVEGNLRAALDEIAALEVVAKVRSVMRMEAGRE